MSDMRFIKSEPKFLDYAWSVFQNYFNNRDELLEHYRNINSDQKKNTFLRVVSYYLFFVREGDITSPNYDPGEIEFVNQTYKYIAMISLIESLFDEEDIEFYEWILQNKEKGSLPINTSQDAERVYKEYKDKYGAVVKTLKFFQSLDDRAKYYLQRSFFRLKEDKESGEYLPETQSIEQITKVLYQIRSDFVHKGELVLEFSPTEITSERDRKIFICSIEFEPLCRIFETGVLGHFGIVPIRRQI